MHRTDYRHRGIFVQQILVHIGDDGHTRTDNRGLVKDKQEHITDTQAQITGYIQIAETLGWISDMRTDAEQT